MICYAGIICEQTLMFCYEFDCLLLWGYYVSTKDQLGKRVWKVLLYDDVVCFLVVLDSIFETLVHIWATLGSLLNELACLSVLLSKLVIEYPWHAFTNSQFDIGDSWNYAQNTPQLHSSAICLHC